MAFGQFGVVVDSAKVEIACPDDECHVAPFFKGEGGFIGELADGFDEVNFVVDCGSVQTSAMADVSGGVASKLLSMANGLACADGGKVEIHGLKDGGWYWINDAMNSAVASLVAKDTLGNDMVMPADPGSSDITLESMKGGATSIVKQASTGRIGILHHVLPEPMKDAPEPAAVCGARYWAPTRSYYSLDSGCMMGDGGTMIVMTGPADTLTGRRTTVPSGGVVYRPTVANSTTSVTFGLWGNGSGHITTASGSAAALKGWNISAAAGHMPTPFVSDFNVTIADSPNSSLSDAEIEKTDGTTLERSTPMQVVPGTDGVDATDGVQPDPEGDGDSTPTPPITAAADDARIENGWGMVDGTAMYCRQAVSHDAGNMLLHFAGVVGGSIILVDPDGDATAEEGTPSEGTATPTLANTSSYTEQNTWIGQWNGPADSDRLIARIDVDADGVGSGDTMTSVPVVVCEMEAGMPTTTVATGGITISASTAHCSRTANHPVKLNISAPLATAVAQNSDIVPEISGARGVTAATTLTVMCPPGG